MSLDSFIDFSQPEVVIDQFESLPFLDNLEPLLFPMEQFSSPEHFSGISSSDTSSPLSHEDSPPTQLIWQQQTPSIIEEEKPKSKRGRKKRVLDLTNNDISAVTKSREDLLKMSYSEFENSLQQILKVRKLTDAEEVEVKRQKRLIKNRESAQNSRTKKKSEVETLEVEVKRLETENSHLSQKVTELTKENTMLKNEVSKLRLLIQKTSGYLPDASNLHIGGSSGPSSTASTTVVLFIMLFSFGLFVTNFSGVNTPQQFGSSLMLPSRILELPSSHQVSYTNTAGRALKAQEFIPSQSTEEYSTASQEVLQFANYKRSENRAPVIDFDSCCDNSVGDNSSNKDHNQRNLDRRLTKIIVSDEENTQRSFGDQTPGAATPQVFAVAGDEPPRIQADLSSHTSKNTTLMTFLNEPNPSNLSKILEFDMDVVPHAEAHQFLEEIQPRRNTAYFTVHSLEQVFPNGADQMFDSDLPLQLSLLISPEALSISVNKKYAKTPMVEIITEVLQVNLAKNFDIFDALPVLA